MRIAISNPDSIGDFVLRQPMLAALQREGHELMLIVREFVVPIAVISFPSVRVVSFAADPYADPYELTSEDSRAALAEIAAFRPEMFVAASFQFTRQEESVAAALPGVQTVGFDGNFFLPGDFRQTTLRRDRIVSVGRDEPEVAKNARMCAEILGRNVELDRPALEIGAELECRRREILDRLGWEPSSYAVVVVGTSDPIRVRNWEMQKWVELLRRLVGELQLRLMFLGSEEEHEESEGVRQAVGGPAGMTVGLTNASLGLPVATALIGSSKCYIGRDTGPMHIAAALGRPVLALFGGGTWPRFLPSALESVVLTVDTPCRPCDWRCHLQSAYCVKNIPIESAWDAARRLLMGEVKGNEVVVLPAGQALLREICESAAVSARETRQAFEAERHQFAQWVRDRDETIEGLRGQLLGTAAVMERTRLRTERTREIDSTGGPHVSESEPTAQHGVGEVELRLEILRETWLRRLRAKHRRVLQMRADLQSAERERQDGADRLYRIAERNRELETLVNELTMAREAASAQLRTALLERERAQAETASRCSRLEGLVAELRQKLEFEQKKGRQAFRVIPELRDNLATAEKELSTQRLLSASAGRARNAISRFVSFLKTHASSQRGRR